MIRYIYPLHPARNGRLVVPVNAIGHVQSPNGVWCGENIAPAATESRPLPGRKICAMCLDAAGLAKRPPAKDRKRQAELDKWERLTGERPGR